MVIFDKQTVWFRDLGVMEYRHAWDYQEKLLQQNIAVKAAANADDPTRNTKPETRHHLLFVEHPPVYTLGKSGKEENVLIGEAERLEKGISFYKTNRGGDITFHGFDQVVGYPILDLEKFTTDIGKYLRNL